ncbi:MAG: CDP-alcohol phosphatidyltransferase family protein [Gammaproteobacteria bacterium]|jgi:cardiolipin synthase|nr:CDP-alcohol phosphatidyltransferase family protein [Gammaproteobacteria bacterium]
MLQQTPNLLTVARILLVPVLAYLIVHRQFQPAFWVAIVAGISDAVDGYLAKRFGWVSRFGGIADPLADKLMTIVTFASLAWVDLLPWWLVLMTFCRDLVIVVGAAVYHFSVEPVKARPTAVSKLNTVLQIALLALVLLQAAAYGQWQTLVQAGIYAVAVTTVVSMFQYMIIWSGKAQEVWRNKGRRLP